MLTASPVNVLVSDASRDAGAGGFSFFAFAVVGLPLLLGTMALCLLLAPRVVPHRTSRLLPPEAAKSTDPLNHRQGTENWSSEDHGGKQQTNQSQKPPGDPLRKKTGTEDW